MNPEINWINKFESDILGLNHDTFFSKSMQRDIGYGIYIPKKYKLKSSIATYRRDKIPIIYWLHGRGGDESTGFKLKIPEKFHLAIQEGEIKPAIMVFPNCGSFSMFCDSYDHSIMGETILVKELIPLIDSTYKIEDSGKLQAIEGFSMGGFGALKLAFKFPKLFSSVVTYAGAFHDLESLLTNRPEVFKAMFSSKVYYFKQNSPYILAEKNLELIKDNVKLKLLNGSHDFTLKNNYKINDRLDNLGIEYKFELLKGFKHDPKPYYETESLNGYKFHFDSFKASKE